MVLVIMVIANMIKQGEINAINVENTQIYIIQFVGNAQNVIYIFVLFAMILLFPDLVQYIILKQS